jgi:biopolymer transport protein ExbD
MSHGTDTEPDLTAMLDMVMQLLFFFIVCAGFIKSEKNEDIKLPESTEAHLITRVDANSYTVNVIPYRREDLIKHVGGGDPAFIELVHRVDQYGRGSVSLTDKQAQLLDKMDTIQNLFPEEGAPCILIRSEALPLRTRDFEVWLERKANDLKGHSTDGKIDNSIIMRADKNLDYALVFRLLKMCKLKGFQNLKLRALVESK